MEKARSRAASKAVARPRRRMAAQEREEMILREAISYFAEVGFEGQLQELARRANITKPLIFKYFPNKQALIDRVYEEVYLRRWNPQWDELLEDRSRPLPDRLIEFYEDYLTILNRHDWIRIFLFSGLRDLDISRRYIGFIQNRIVNRICGELRAHCGLPGFDQIPISEIETEMVWGLHGSFVYIAIRKWVYHVRTPDSASESVQGLVNALIDGAPKFLKGLASASRAANRKTGTAP